MSFSTDCKEELMQQPPANDCCRNAQLYGFLCFFSALGTSGLALSCEHTETLLYLKALMESCGFPLPADAVQTGRKYSSFKVNDSYICERVYNDFGFADDAPRLRIHRDFFLCSDCSRAFIAGAFLAAGAVSGPNSGYHLEFATHRAKIAQDLVELLRDHGFRPKFGARGYDKLIYFKDSSQIEDILAYMGASAASMQLMQTKIFKDVRNQVTRRVNCDQANMKKVVAAAQQDAALLQRFVTAGGRELLSEELRQLLDLRLGQPDLSMSDLAELLGGGITKSGVSHRLRKLRQIAEQHLEQRN